MHFCFSYTQAPCPAQAGGIFNTKIMNATIETSIVAVTWPNNINLDPHGPFEIMDWLPYVTKPVTVSPTYEPNVWEIYGVSYHIRTHLHAYFLFTALQLL
jgi:hypothetical protein